MLFNQDLETIIFERHNYFETDELIILSGYLGPSPIHQIQDLPFESKVIYGMYGSDRITQRLHSSLLALHSTISNLNIYYSRTPVHSKCYVWKRGGSVIHALVGSANFSSSGLRTPFKEILAETSRDTFVPLNNYLREILESSLICNSEEITFREMPPAPQPDVPDMPREICRMTLLDSRTGETHRAHGLNWGQDPRHHTNPNDANIPIRARYIRGHSELFPEKLTIPTRRNGRGRPHRHNDAIEILWDDEVTMEGLLEGSIRIDGRIYPKQISSFPRKSELGIYFRTRLGVPLGARVTRQHLENYGRTHADLSLLSEGVYYCDFSV